MQLLPGGLIGFVTREPLADFINVCSFGLPGVSIYHCGILSSYAGELLLYESTNALRPPCCLTGNRPKGVAARPISEIQEYFAGTDQQLWYYPLRSPLYDHESERLADWLSQQIGRRYDLDGAYHSGGGLVFRTLASVLRKEDLTSLFCSEMCAGGLMHVGRLVTPNVSVWNPNRLTRYLVRKGICGKPQRLQ